MGAVLNQKKNKKNKVALYERGKYPALSLPPIKNYNDYLLDLNKFAEYFSQNQWHKNKFLFLFFIWDKFVGFKNFIETLNTKNKNLEDFFLYEDRQRVFRHSLLSINYALVLKNSQHKTSMYSRATSLVQAAFYFHQQFLNAKIPCDEISGQYLEMGQYANLFGTSLREGKKDLIIKTLNSKFIIVSVKGRYFPVELNLLSTNQIDINQLCCDLNEIVELSQNEKITFVEKKQSHEMSYLSLLHRDKVYKIFKRLRKSPLNQTSLNFLEQAYLILNLDHNISPKNEDDAIQKLYTQNLTNRWFPAGIQITIFQNAMAGLILNNRIYLDGNVGARFAKDLFLISEQILGRHNFKPTTNIKKTFLPLNFNLSLRDVAKAKKEVNSLLDNEQTIFKIKNLGKDDLLAYKVNPDVAFKLALALTMQRVQNINLKQIQILNMSKYAYHGIIHGFISTEESHMFCRYLTGSSWNYKEAAELLSGALKAHSLAQKNSRKGLTLLHILGFFLTQISIYKKVVTFFIAYLSNIKNLMPQVITSHPQEMEEVVGFGRPGIKIFYVRYFGLHYQIFSDHIKLIFMSGHKWKVPKEDFFKALNQALNDIVQIIRCPEWRKLQTIHDSHSSTITQVSKEHAEIITQLKS